MVYSNLEHHRNMDKMRKIFLYLPAMHNDDICHYNTHKELVTIKAKIMFQMFVMNKFDDFK